MGDAAKELPKTDKGLAVYLRNLAAPPERTWIALGDGLTMCLEPSGMKHSRPGSAARATRRPAAFASGASPRCLSGPRGPSSPR